MHSDKRQAKKDALLEMTDADVLEMSDHPSSEDLIASVTSAIERLDAAVPDFLKDKLDVLYGGVAEGDRSQLIGAMSVLTKEQLESSFEEILAHSRTQYDAAAVEAAKEAVLRTGVVVPASLKDKLDSVFCTPASVPIENLPVLVNHYSTLSGDDGKAQLQEMLETVAASLSEQLTARVIQSANEAVVRTGT